MIKKNTSNFGGVMRVAFGMAVVAISAMLVFGERALIDLTGTPRLLIGLVGLFGGAFMIFEGLFCW